MRIILVNILKLKGLVLLAFFFYRLAFLASNGNVYNVFTSMYHGFKTDLSILSIIFILPYLLLLVISLLQSDNLRWDKLLTFLFLLPITVSSIIEVVSIDFFEHWGTNFNYRALSYLKEPSIALGTSAEHFSILSLLLILSAPVILFIPVKHLFFQLAKSSKRINSIFYLILIGFSLIMVRGGVQKIPLNSSSSCYSLEQVNNMAAVNASYYLFESVVKSSKSKVLAYKTPDKILNTFKQSLKVKAGKHSIFTKTKKPNIIFILLEGWPKLLLEGERPSAKYVNSLRKDGLFFSNVYSSGFRTDQGLLSIFSALPSLGDLNTLNMGADLSQFPSLGKVLINRGYNNNFYYGGDLNFSNLKNYLYLQGVKKLVGINDFNKNQNTMDWGVPDHLVFEKVLIDHKNLMTPFMTSILTLSSHTPFDFPGAKKDSSIEVQFENSVEYLDSSIQDFMKKASLEDWYSNTIFVFVADHGSIYQNEISYNSHKRFHVPLLMVGEPLIDSLKGKEIGTIGNTFDIPSTILELLGIKEDSLSKISKGLGQSLFSSKDYSFWSYGNIIGWNSGVSSLVFNKASGKQYSYEGIKGEELKVQESALLFHDLIIMELKKGNR